MQWKSLRAIYVVVGDACLRLVGLRDRDKRKTETVRFLLAMALMWLVGAVHFAQKTFREFEDVTVLRTGQRVDARVTRVELLSKGGVSATLTYDSSGAGGPPNCSQHVSMGYRPSWLSDGKQITVSIRPGSCTRPVIWTSEKWPWIFAGSSLFILACSFVMGMAWIRCVRDGSKRPDQALP